MIVIYNLAGLLVGAAGLAFGLALFALTNRVGVGALALAVVWMVLGFLWRSWKTSPGQPRPYPSVYFIPLPFLAIPIVPLAFLLLVVEQMGSHGAAGPGGAIAADDARAALLKEDESSLDRARLGGDLELSERLATRLTSTLSEEAKADAYHIFTRVNPENVLVLIKAPNLKSYKENARVQLLHAIGEILSEDDGLKAKKVYIGVKGRIAFGAIQVPPGRVETGSVLRDSPLRDFYGPLAIGADSSDPGAGIVTDFRHLKGASSDHAPPREPVQPKDVPGRLTPEVAPQGQTGGPPIED